MEGLFSGLGVNHERRSALGERGAAHDTSRTTGICGTRDRRCVCGRGVVPEKAPRSRRSAGCSEAGGVLPEAEWPVRRRAPARGPSICWLVAVMGLRDSFDHPHRGAPGSVLV